MRRIRKTLAIVLGLLSLSSLARADDACMDFKWDVSRERALYAGTPLNLGAAANRATAPSTTANKLYMLKLAPQEKTEFVVTPGKKNPGIGGYAGMVILQISTPGSYRISIDEPLWVDVVSDGALLTAKDFQSQKACA